MYDAGVLAAGRGTEPQLSGRRLKALRDGVEKDREALADEYRRFRKIEDKKVSPKQAKHALTHTH